MPGRSAQALAEAQSEVANRLERAEPCLCSNRNGGPETRAEASGEGGP